VYDDDPSGYYFMLNVPYVIYVIAFICMYAIHGTTIVKKMNAIIQLEKQDEERQLADGDPE